jgi:hypothetical protein
MAAGEPADLESASPGDVEPRPLANQNTPKDGNRPTPKFIEFSGHHRQRLT